MLLQQILFGTWTPPQASRSMIHRIGFASESRYTPPKKVRIYHKVVSKETLMGSRKLIYDMIKRRNEYVSANDIGKKANYTRNHCSIICTSLFKLGLVERKLIRENGTRYYLYKVKDEE